MADARILLHSQLLQPLSETQLLLSNAACVDSVQSAFLSLWYTQQETSCEQSYFSREHCRILAVGQICICMFHRSADSERASVLYALWHSAMLALKPCGHLCCLESSCICLWCQHSRMGYAVQDKMSDCEKVDNDQKDNTDCCIKLTEAAEAFQVKASNLKALQMKAWHARAVETRPLHRREPDLQGAQCASDRQREAQHRASKCDTDTTACARSKLDASHKRVGWRQTLADTGCSCRRLLNFS